MGDVGADPSGHGEHDLLLRPVRGKGHDGRRHGLLGGSHAERVGGGRASPKFSPVSVTVVPPSARTRGTAVVGADNAVLTVDMTGAGQAAHVLTTPAYVHRRGVTSREASIRPFRT